MKRSWALSAGIFGCSRWGIVGDVSVGSAHELSLEFEARDTHGTVEVSLWVNRDPSVVGSGSEAEGFPACQATVATDLQGYASLFGWVQLVGTESPDDPTRRFEVDPLEISADLNWPFGFFGLLPTMFDAPSRRNRTQTLDWLAHTFLCVSPHSPMDRVVRPVVGFRWGFRMHDGQTDIVAPNSLALFTWNGHLTVLEAAYPGWRFERVPPI
jgi:hypothetical protein